MAQCGFSLAPHAPRVSYKLKLAAPRALWACGQHAVLKLPDCVRSEVPTRRGALREDGPALARLPSRSLSLPCQLQFGAFKRSYCPPLPTGWHPSGSWGRHAHRTEAGGLAVSAL
eukprot:350572-Chlamydomonas_euryale.AAC.8